MDELKQVWDVTHDPPESRDVDAAWNEIKDQMVADAPTASEQDTDLKRSSADPPAERSLDQDEERATRPIRPRRRRGGWHLFLRVGAFAGVIVVAVLLSFLFLNEGLSHDGQTRTFSTKPGERATIHLSDGSKVRLNVDSRLTLPADFDEGTREVTLTGEAYFEVTRDTTRPFVIRAHDATVEVLGTTFDVKAYADDHERQVAVAEGAVALRSEQAGTQDTVLLRAQHLGIVSGPHIQTFREDTNIEHRLAWTRGQLVFEDARFREVHRRLERWYDVQVETQVNPRTVDRLNASFDEEPVGEAIKAIAAALDLQYQRDDRTILFYRPGQDPEFGSKRLPEEGIHSS
jgi:ferric-dicitrate binding protein FerR (iron transport regulator)